MRSAQHQPEKERKPLCPARDAVAICAEACLLTARLPDGQGMGPVPSRMLSGRDRDALFAKAPAGSTNAGLLPLSCLGHGRQVSADRFGQAKK